MAYYLQRLQIKFPKIYKEGQHNIGLKVGRGVINPSIGWMPQ
jgi:hypothetical protein